MNTCYYFDPRELITIHIEVYLSQYILAGRFQLAKDEFGVVETLSTESGFRKLNKYIILYTEM